ncbi:MAG: hypothetical protein LUQ64_03000 [Methanomicrobiales archaeon]|nr:hypothetical protein [Methanomicrobiales archaeon]
MRAGTKLVLTIVAAIVLHIIFYYFLVDPAALERGVYFSDALLGSLILNLVGVPIGIFLGKTDTERAAGGTVGVGRRFMGVFGGWVIFFGPLTALGLLIGKFITDAIWETGELPPARPGPEPSFSVTPVSSFRMNR